MSRVRTAGSIKARRRDEEERLEAERTRNCTVTLSRIAVRCLADLEWLDCQNEAFHELLQLIPDTDDPAFVYAAIAMYRNRLSAKGHPAAAQWQKDRMSALLRWYGRTGDPVFLDAMYALHSHLLSDRSGDDQVESPQADNWLINTDAMAYRVAEAYKLHGKARSWDQAFDMVAARSKMRVEPRSDAPGLYGARAKMKRMKKIRNHLPTLSEMAFVGVEVSKAIKRFRQACELASRMQIEQTAEVIENLNTRAAAWRRHGSARPRLAATTLSTVRPLVERRCPAATQVRKLLIR